MRKTKMNFNIVALIMLGISIFCIVIGLLFGGLTSFYFDQMGFHIDKDMIKEYHDEKTFTDIDSLLIDVSFMEVEVKPGVQNKVVVTGMKENTKPSITIQDKILKIQSSKKHRGFSLGFFKIPDRHTKITVYLKPDTTLKDTKIDASFSSVTMKQLVSDQCNIDSSFGEIDITAKTRKVTIDSSFGEVKATLDGTERIDAASSFGDITLWISRPKAYFQVQTNSSFGDIHTTDHGTSTEIVGANRGNIILDNSFGEINLNFTK